jgi:hypothetical protein
MQVHLVELELKPIVGLPALLRMSPGELIDFIVKTHSGSDLAAICMQMFYVLMALSQDEFALDMQAGALAIQRTYRIAGPISPKVRLLAFMGPGNMLCNTPLDFIVEHNSIQLDLLYLLPNEGLPTQVPEHDIAFVAIGESEMNSILLAELEAICESWPRPILNRPAKVRHCARDICYSKLKDIPDLVMPQTRRINRHARPDFNFPFTIRPTDTHGGNGLARIDGKDDLQVYYENFPSHAYYIAEYIDYRSDDGYFRKLRFVIIDGDPYICHLAISSNWIVHYLSAGMDEDANKRAEEQVAMETFEEDFAVRFKPQIASIAKMLALDYVTVDCAQLKDGRLLVFEVDTRGLVHAADAVDIYPYKPAIMQKAFDAFESMLTKHLGRLP